MGVGYTAHKATSSANAATKSTAGHDTFAGLQMAGLYPNGDWVSRSTVGTPGAIMAYRVYEYTYQVPLTLKYRTAV